MRILVVDDDRIIRIGLNMLINRLFDCHEVISDFQNGLVALEYLKENEIDIVITDIKMPVMTGDELVRESMLTLERPPVFIVLSGYDEYKYVRDTMKTGAFNYLLKPVDEVELKNVLEEVEVKIKENKRQDVIRNKSMDLLKKDFFKNILFSNSEVKLKTDKYLLENIQIDEGYIYKMVILQGNKEKELLGKFLKNIIKTFDSLENLYFNFEDNIYFIFYFDSSRVNYIDALSEDIILETKEFIEKNINVYIMKETDKVWMLRDQVRSFRKMKARLMNKEVVKQYVLKFSEEEDNDINEVDEKSNTIAVKLAKQYIINNFNKNITLKDVADEVFLTQNYLSELFKKETGEGFYDFLSKYRINIAKDLLVSTNLRIYEISDNVGYNDPVTFGRVFKKITGNTPNAFRNNKTNFK